MALISEKVLKRRHQELGKIKIGRLGDERPASGGGTFRLPVKIDHFIVTTRQRGPDGNFIRDAQIHEHPSVGEKPTELHGVLMFSTPEENLHAEFVRYQGRKKIWSCNGEEATDLKSGACSTCPRLQDKECPCKPYVRFPVQLWASPALGYHVFRSTSWETTANLQSALYELHERFGTCYHAPVKLVVYPAEDSYEDGGKTKTSTSWKVGLVLSMSMEEATRHMVTASKRLALAKREMKLLAGEVHADLESRDLEEEEVIADEFFSDAGGEASIATQERLDALKDQLGVGQEAGAPVVDAEFEIEGGADTEEPEGDQPPATAEAFPATPADPPPAPEETEEQQVDRLIKELGALRDEAPTRGLRLTAAHHSSIKTAIDGRDAAHLRIGVDWLKSQIEKVEAERTTKQGG